MEKLMLAPVMSALNKNAVVIRKQFTAERKRFVPKDQPAVGALLDLLCQEPVSIALSHEAFGTMMEAVLSDNVRDVRWLSRYCELISRSLAGSREKTHNDARAARYEQYLQNELIPSIKQQTGNTKQAPNMRELWLTLADIFKIAAALHSYYSGAPFSMRISRDAMEHLTSSLQKPVNPPPAKLRPAISIDLFRPEERSFAILLSWILTEIVCIQDDIDSKEE